MKTTAICRLISLSLIGFVTYMMEGCKKVTDNNSQGIDGTFLYGDTGILYQVVSREVEGYYLNYTLNEMYHSSSFKDGRSSQKIMFRPEGQYKCDSMIWATLGIPSESTYYPNSVAPFDTLVIGSGNIPRMVVEVKRMLFYSSPSKHRLVLRRNFLHSNGYFLYHAKIILEAVH